MLKVPSLQCSFTHRGTSFHKFLGKHEVPLLRANTRLQQGATELLVERPVGGLDAAHYWATFPSVEFEFDRVRRVYGGPLVDTVYATLDDFKEVIEAELEKVAGNRGVNPHAPKAIVADPAVLDLVLKATPVPADADKAAKDLNKAEATEIAVALAKIGVLSVEDVASNPLTKLCEALRVTTEIAANIRKQAQDLLEANAQSDKDRGGSLDLGVLTGRTLE